MHKALAAVAGREIEPFCCASERQVVLWRVNRGGTPARSLS